MSIRESLLENFTGDLEYHPRRAVLYLALSAAAAAFWLFCPPERKFTTIPLVFALGALALLVKAVFLLRRSSEGIGLTDAELNDLSSPAKRKRLPAIPSQAAQLFQDFGGGSLLLWPLLNVAKDFDERWTDPPRVSIGIIGASLFLLGWIVRRFTSGG